MFRKTFLTLLLLFILYWIPFGIIFLKAESNIISSINRLPDSDVTIIFGTLVNDGGDVTPLLKERLEAGKAILESGKSKKMSFPTPTKRQT